ncbi:MAG: S8 family serine peptidase [Phycisphaerae bacterium]|jgi:subtilisin family serine protease
MFVKCTKVASILVVVPVVSGLIGCWPGIVFELPDVGQGDVLFTEDDDPAVAELPSVETELLVRSFPGADDEAVSTALADAGAAVVGRLDEIGATVLEVPTGRRDVVARQLADSGVFEGVHKNYLFAPTRVPNDPMYTRQTHLTRIGADLAWDTTVGDENVIVAVVDTGVDVDHPDLSERILDGWNAHTGGSDYADVHGHGTQVAGVVAATSGNGVGVSGVTWGCPILAVRVSDLEGRASARHIAAGILWAANHGAKVINVSFSPLWSNRVVRAAATEAFNRGSLVVISTGNGGAMTTVFGYSEALFVGAISSANLIAPFSDRGPFVDLVAPGTAIRTTGDGGAYTMANGTSFAAPVVAGVAALAWSVNLELRPVTIASALTESAVDLGTVGKDTTYGHGLVDAASAVDRAARVSFVPDTTPPTLIVNRPLEGAAVSSFYVVYATASDVWGVADVVMSIDGIEIATDTLAPYFFVIDTRRFPAGRHEVSFVATDHAGNATEPIMRNVNFLSSAGSSSTGATEIRFTSPVSGASVSYDTNIRASISDPDGLATVEWFVDGVPVHTGAVSGQSTGVSYMWRIAAFDAGLHTITLIVTDLQGFQTTGQLNLTKR